MFFHEKACQAVLGAAQPKEADGRLQFREADRVHII
jgi:hypothetical protein